jgi:hypothetical protein
MDWECCPGYQCIDGVCNAPPPAAPEPDLDACRERGDYCGPGTCCQVGDFCLPDYVTVEVGRCCSLTNGPCDDDHGCCGQRQCVGGSCACQPTQENCTTWEDCCQNGEWLTPCRFLFGLELLGKCCGVDGDVCATSADCCLDADFACYSDGRCHVH